MAKSKATFNKKEKEKQKQKKRKEKAEKREERKLTSNKGKNFDEMFAFVDEYGVISSTPPDLTKKKQIKKEDIQISIPKHEKRSEDERRRGVVSFYNNDKGFGFIKDDISKERIFVHASELKEEVKENDIVTFKAEYSHRGMTAVDVRK